MIDKPRILQGAARLAETFRTRRFMLAIVAGLGILSATTACDRSRQSNSDSGTRPPASFINKVWTVAESPSGASGELYLFLSEGTFVIAAPEVVPILGRWNRDGQTLTIAETGLPYKVEILSLTDTEFRFRAIHDLGSAEFLLVPARQSVPDSTRPVEFNPSESRVIAHGSEPAWLLTVDGGVARLRTQGKGEVFTDGVWEQQDAPSWIYEAHRSRADGDDVLLVTITRGRCVQDTSGAEYPLSARLDWGGSELVGCALVGESQGRP